MPRVTSVLLKKLRLNKSQPFKPHANVVIIKKQCYTAYVIKIKPKFILRNLSKSILENRLVLSAAFGLKVGRPMTAGEIKLAHDVFGNSIKYHKVRIVKKPYTIGDTKAFAMRNYIFIPSHWDKNGDLSINFVKQTEKGLTYSALSMGTYRKSVFLHEMTHVWQRPSPFKTKDIKDKLQALIGRDVYAYNLNKVTDAAVFSSLGHEQQAQFIEDYVRTKEIHTHIQDCKYYRAGEPMTLEDISRIKKGSGKSINRREPIIQSVFSLT